MQNFICGVDYDKATYNKLCIKIFTGKSENVEKEVQLFLNSHPIQIKNIKQTSFKDNGEFGIILTMFYYSEGKPQFIDERWTIDMLTRKIAEELDGIYGITIEDIQKIIWDKQDQSEQNQIN